MGRITMGRENGKKAVKVEKQEVSETPIVQPPQIIYRDVIKEVPVEVEKIVEKVVEVDRIVEIKVPEVIEGDMKASIIDIMNTIDSEIERLDERCDEIVQVQTSMGKRIVQDNDNAHTRMDGLQKDILEHSGAILTQSSKENDALEKQINKQIYQLKISVGVTMMLAAIGWYF